MLQAGYKKLERLSLIADKVQVYAEVASLVLPENYPIELDEKSVLRLSVVRGNKCKSVETIEVNKLSAQKYSLRVKETLSFSTTLYYERDSRKYQTKNGKIVLDLLLIDFNLDSNRRTIVNIGEAVIPLHEVPKQEISQGNVHNNLTRLNLGGIASGGYIEVFLSFRSLMTSNRKSQSDLSSRMLSQASSVFSKSQSMPSAVSGEEEDFNDFWSLSDQQSVMSSISQISDPELRSEVSSCYTDDNLFKSVSPGASPGPPHRTSSTRTMMMLQNLSPARPADILQLQKALYQSKQLVADLASQLATTEETNSTLNTQIRSLQDELLTKEKLVNTANERVLLTEERLKRILVSSAARLWRWKRDYDDWYTSTNSSVTGSSCKTDGEGTDRGGVVNTATGDIEMAIDISRKSSMSSSHASSRDDSDSERTDQDTIDSSETTSLSNMHHTAVTGMIIGGRRASSSSICSSNGSTTSTCTPIGSGLGPISASLTSSRSSAVAPVTRYLLNQELIAERDALERKCTQQAVLLDDQTRQLRAMKEQLVMLERGDSSTVKPVCDSGCGIGIGISIRKDKELKTKVRRSTEPDLLACHHTGYRHDDNGSFKGYLEDPIHDGSSASPITTTDSTAGTTYDVGAGIFSGSSRLGVEDKSVSEGSMKGLQQRSAEMTRLDARLLELEEDLRDSKFNTEEALKTAEEQRVKSLSLSDLLSQKESTIIVLELQLMDAGKRLEDLEANIVALEHEKRLLTDKLTDNSNKTNDLAKNLRCVQAELAASMIDLEVSRELLSSTKTRYDIVFSERDGLVSQIERQDSQISSLQSQILKLIEEIDSLKGLEEVKDVELDHLKILLAQQQQGSERLSVEMEDAMYASELATEQLKSLKMSSDGLTGELASEQQKRASAEEALRLTDADLQTKEMEISALTSRVAALVEELKGLTESSTMKAVEAEEWWKGLMDSYKKEQQELQTMNMDLREQLSSLESRGLLMEAEAVTKDKKVNELETKLGTVLEENKILNEALEINRDQFVDISLQMKETQRREIQLQSCVLELTEQLSSDLEAMRGRLSHRELSVQEQSREFVELVGAYKRLVCEKDDKILELQTQIEACKVDLDSFSQAKTALEKEIDRLSGVLVIKDLNIVSLHARLEELEEVDGELDDMLVAYKTLSETNASLEARLHVVTDILCHVVLEARKTGDPLLITM